MALPTFIQDAIVAHVDDIATVCALFFLAVLVIPKHVLVQMALGSSRRRYSRGSYVHASRSETIRLQRQSRRANDYAHDKGYQAYLRQNAAPKVAKTMKKSNGPLRQVRLTRTDKMKNNYWKHRAGKAFKAPMPKTFSRSGGSLR